MPPGTKQDSATDSEKTNGKGLSKMECVRRIVTKKGIDIKPLDIQTELKRKYKLDMDTTVISTYKNNIKKELKRKGKGGRPKKRKGRAGSNSAGASTGITMNEVQAVKDLVDRLGAEKLRELAAIFAK